MVTEKQVAKALDLFEDVLSARPNVVGLGIVPAREEGGGQEMAIGVYVSKKLPKDRLSEDEIIPPEVEIKARGGKVRVRTRVIEQGEISLESVGRESL